jgi:hypothetical protein
MVWPFGWVAVYTRFRDFFETLRVKSRRRCQAGFSRILKQLGSEGTPSNGAEVRFAMPEFDEWESFYVIVGAAAGALIGLQFVVMTLVAERPPLRAAEAGTAFATPTIVHFSAALLLSALLRVPWHTSIMAGAVLGAVAVGGIGYGLFVAHQMGKQTAYKPDFEDWVCFALLPIIAYGLLLLSAIAIPFHMREGLFGVGAATLLLLFIGIHNAWDSVAYLVYANTQRDVGQQPRGASENEK